MSPRTLVAVVLWALASVGSTILFDGTFERSLARSVHALGDPDPAAQERALARVESAGPDAVPALIGGFALIDHGVTKEVRRAHTLRTASILRRLRALDRGTAVPALVEALGDDDSAARHYAGIALASMGEDAVPALAAALRESPSAQIRTSAAWTLSLVGPAARAALPELTDALADEHREVRYTARYAIETLDPKNDAFWAEVQKRRQQAQSR